jgi:hypothetical protein
MKMTKIIVLMDLFVYPDEVDGLQNIHALQQRNHVALWRSQMTVLFSMRLR